MRATVLIPTHDHGRILELPLRSALAQTARDIEVFVVGDGAPEETAELVSSFMARDPRVRWFPNSKGPRHGELHRHAALAHARGRIVCYLTDDDLWLPEHVEVLDEMLGDHHDFAHTLSATVGPEGHLDVKAVDLARPEYRARYLAGANEVSPTVAAHTLAAYRRLPHGWRTTPAGVPTDLYMWQQFLAQPWCRAVSGWRWTSLHFASTQRVGWSRARRIEELDRWAARLAEPQERARIERELLATAARNLADVALRVPG